MRTRIRYVLILSCTCLWSVYLYAQREIKPCHQEPAFVKTLGFDPLWTGFSTSEKKAVGISLIAFEKNAGESAPTPLSAKAAVYQHPSWKQAGYLSTITLDQKGNVYAIPAPLISMLYNKPEKLNTIYQIDAKTGEMGEWISLPFYGKPGVNNPYGLLGIAYDCLQQTMAVASVAGSDRYNERGVIYLIDVQTKKIIDTISNTDAMGLAFALDEKGSKRLYFGKTRSGELHSVQVATNRKWIRKTKRKELTLEGYGPRGDDKARKIKFNGNQMVVSGTAFNYNLQASSEKPETVYTFIWLPKEQKWGLNQYQ